MTTKTLKQIPPHRTWEYRRARLEAKRARMIAELGGKCVDCGTDESLEFDHKYPRTWKAAEKSWEHRLAIYAREIVFGLIELRCKRCNRAKGMPAPAAGSAEEDQGGYF